MECDVPRVSRRELAGSRVEQLLRIINAGLLGAILRIAGRRTRNLVVHRVPDDVSADELKQMGAWHLTWNTGEGR